MHQACQRVSLDFTAFYKTVTTRLLHMLQFVRAFGSKRKSVVSIWWPASDYERLAMARFMRLDTCGPAGRGKKEARHGTDNDKAGGIL